MRDSAENVHFDLGSGRIEELLSHNSSSRIVFLKLQLNCFITSLGNLSSQIQLC